MVSFTMDRTTGEIIAAGLPQLIDVEIINKYCGFLICKALFDQL